MRELSEHQLWSVTIRVIYERAHLWRNAAVRPRNWAWKYFHSTAGKLDVLGLAEEYITATKADISTERQVAEWAGMVESVRDQLRLAGWVVGEEKSTIPQLLAQVRTYEFGGSVPSWLKVDDET